MPQEEYTKAEELLMQLKTYVATEIELVKLTAAQKLSKLLSDFIAVIIAGAIFTLFVLFASFALAYFLGEWIGKIWAGFLIVAVLYLLVGAITWVAREKLLRVPFMNAIIRQFFSREQLNKI